MHMCMRMQFAFVCVRMHAWLSFLTRVQTLSSRLLHAFWHLMPALLSVSLPMGVQCNNISTQSSLTLVSVAAGYLTARERRQSLHERCLERERKRENREERVAEGAESGQKRDESILRLGVPLGHAVRVDKAQILRRPGKESEGDE